MKKKNEKVTLDKLNLLPRELAVLLKDHSDSGKSKPISDTDTKSIGDRGAPKKRSNMRQYNKEVQTLWLRLHHQLYKIYGGFVVSPNERGAHIKLWYNGDLKELYLACKKTMNICKSLDDILKEEKLWRR